MASNYKYKINTKVKCEGRKAFIKHLNAMALYMTENVTDEDFHLMALGLKDMPDVETFRIVGMEEM